LFLTLGLLVFPSRIFPVAGIGLLIAGFLIFIARPLSVFLSLSFFKVSIKSKLFISWVGLRGAVPIVFATYPLIAGLEKSGMIFNLVFFIAVSSVLLQGTTLPWLAKKLKLIDDSPVAALAPGDLAEMQQYIIQNDSPALNKKIVDLHLPTPVKILVIKRKNLYIKPDGFTKIQAGDTLYLLAADKETMSLAMDII
jgi:cell volume regulation protein A